MDREPGGLSPWGRRVGHDGGDWPCMCACTASEPDFAPQARLYKAEDKEEGDVSRKQEARVL